MLFISSKMWNAMTDFVNQPAIFLGLSSILICFMNVAEVSTSAISIFGVQCVHFDAVLHPPRCPKHWTGPLFLWIARLKLLTVQLDFISSSCQKHFPLMCSLSSINFWSCKLQCQGWIMDGQDIASRKGTLSAYWGTQRKITFLCLDCRATPDDAVHCCSIRWKSSGEMLLTYTERERERFSAALASCSLCYSASCGSFCSRIVFACA